MKRQLDRREFLKSGSRAGAGMVFAGAALLAAATAALGLLVPGKRHADLARAQGPLALAEAPVGPEA